MSLRSLDNLHREFNAIISLSTIVSAINCGGNYAHIPEYEDKEGSIQAKDPVEAAEMIQLVEQLLGCGLGSHEIFPVASGTFPDSMTTYTSSRTQTGGYHASESSRLHAYASLLVRNGEVVAVAHGNRCTNKLLVVANPDCNDKHFTHNSQNCVLLVELGNSHLHVLKAGGWDGIFSIP
jgi:hypothetical protein